MTKLATPDSGWSKELRCSSILFDCLPNMEKGHELKQTLHRKAGVTGLLPALCFRLSMNEVCN